MCIGASHCGDFSCCRALGSRVGFSGCETSKECGEEEGSMICHLQRERKKGVQAGLPQERLEVKHKECILDICFGIHRKSGLSSSFWDQALSGAGTSFWA